MIARGSERKNFDMVCWITADFVRQPAVRQSFIYPLFRRCFFYFSEKNIIYIYICVCRSTIISNARRLVYNLIKNTKDFCELRVKLTVVAVVTERKIVSLVKIAVIFDAICIFSSVRKKSVLFYRCLFSSRSIACFKCYKIMFNV